MAIHCQCRVITSKVVDKTIEGFVLQQNGTPPTKAQVATQLAADHGKPKCAECSCKLPDDIAAFMERMFPESVAMAAE